jgi:tetratricopeptide (TPR) repeat protein
LHADSLLAAARGDLLAATRKDESLARAWYTLSELYTVEGELAEADLAADKALRTYADVPEERRVLYRTFFQSLYQEDYGEAARWCDIGQRLIPEDRNFVECVLTVLAWSGDSRNDVDRAWRLVAKIDSLPKMSDGRPFRQLYVAAILARAGLSDSSRNVLERTLSEAPDYVATDLAPLEAYVNSLLGDHKQALRLLAFILEREPQRKGFIRLHPWYKGLRDEPEFQDLVRETR